MAGREQVEGHTGSRRRRTHDHKHKHHHHHRPSRHSSPPNHDNDWVGPVDVPSDSPPRSIHSAELDEGLAIVVEEDEDDEDADDDDDQDDHETAASTSRRRNRLSSRHRRRSRPPVDPPPRRSSSMRVSAPAAPGLERSATVPHHRRPTNAYPEEERPSRSHARQSDPRRDRDASSRYRSTPETKRSSRSSEAESDEETDSTASSVEERGVSVRPKDRELTRTVLSSAQRSSRRSQHFESPRTTREPQIIYEEDAEEDDDEEELAGELRYVPSPNRTRSPSRHSTDRYDRHRPPRRQSLGRRSRVDGGRSRSVSKISSRRYYESEGTYYDRPVSVRRSRTTAASQIAPSQLSGASSARRSSLLGSFFGQSVQYQPADRSLRSVECVACMEDDLPAHKTAKLKCGHRMCHGCLKRVFRLSVSDPQHMPPKCCTSDHIPLKHVDRLLDDGFKRVWNKKLIEYSTRNRLYCPSRRCGEWIGPENITHRDGRRVGRCGRCMTKVCGMCNGKWHTSRDCPRDEATNAFLEQAKEEGWQRCHRCKAVIELKEGCNHMTCRCGAEFCMICGVKWKKCDCPWFSYETAEQDMLEDLHISSPIRTSTRVPFEPEPRDPGYTMASSSAAPEGSRSRPRVHDEEHLVRRFEDRRDDGLSRQRHKYGASRDRKVHDGHVGRDEYVEVDGESHFDDHDDNAERWRRRYGDVAGVRNNTGHYASDGYRRRPETVFRSHGPPPPPVMPVPMPMAMPIPSASHPSSYEHPSSRSHAHSHPPDYVAGASRSRGPSAPSRDSGFEQRLANRFNTDLRGSSGRQSGHPSSVPVPVPMSVPSMPMAMSMPTSKMSMSPTMISVVPTMPTSMSMPPMTNMAMSSVPPPVPTPPAASVAPPPPLPSSRRRIATVEESRYETPRRTRPSDHVPNTSRTRRDYESDVPTSAQTPSRRLGRHRSRYDEPEPELELTPSSAMAGLTGPGRGMSRVFEWRSHVEPGSPEDEAVSVFSV